MHNFKRNWLIDSTCFLHTSAIFNAIMVWRKQGIRKKRQELTNMMVDIGYTRHEVVTLTRDQVAFWLAIIKAVFCQGPGYDDDAI